MVAMSHERVAERDAAMVLRRLMVKSLGTLHSHVDEEVTIPFENDLRMGPLGTKDLPAVVFEDAEFRVGQGS